MAGHIIDAFMSLEQVKDIEIKPVVRKRKKARESLADGPRKEFLIDISGNDMYEKGQAYYHARTGSMVELDGKKYVVTTDDDGNHRIGYTDTIYLMDPETKEKRTVSKSEFIKGATLVKEERGRKDESMEDYYVVSDGLNPRKSLVFDENGREYAIEVAKAKSANGSHWEVLHYVNGNPEKIWEPEMNEEKRKLEPVHDSRKSFYGKAVVDERDDGTKVLYSYGTPVCRIEDGKVTLLRKGYLGWSSSATTLRHVKDFLKQNGFEAGSVHDLADKYPTEQAYAYEGKERERGKTEVSESVKVDLSDKEEVEKGIEVKDEEREDPEVIVDVDAETVDKLKDSYIGNVILQCPACMTLTYKEPDELVKDEETEMYNVGDECHQCGSDKGFNLVGQVASMESEEAKAARKGEDDGLDEPEKEPNDEPEEKEIKAEVDVEDKTIPELKKESVASAITDFDSNKFDKLVTRYATSVYDNVASFSTESGRIDESTGALEIGGTVKFNSGKSRKLTFVFSEGVEFGKSKVKYLGRCESLSDKDGAFTLIGSISDNSFAPTALSYDYETKALNESKEVKGRVSLRRKRSFAEKKGE